MCQPIDPFSRTIFRQHLELPVLFLIQSTSTGIKKRIKTMWASSNSLKNKKHWRSHVSSFRTFNFVAHVLESFQISLDSYLRDKLKNSCRSSRGCHFNGRTYFSIVTTILIEYTAAPLRLPTLTQTILVFLRRLALP